MRSCGGAYNGFRGYIDDLIGLGGVGQPLQQDGDDPLAQGGLVDIEGGQGRRGILGSRDVVKAHHLHILGNMDL